MKKNILLYFIAAFCFIGNYSNSQNINLSNSIYWDGECNLVANPKNPNHLVAAWIYYSTTNRKNTIATRSSFDGGKTWSTLQMQPHVWPNFTCADPTMYFGKDSCVYLAFIDLSGLHSSDSGYIMVTRSTNGGITWNSPVKAISYLAQPNLPIDRPWISADKSTGPYAGRVYVTSQNAYFAPQPHHPWFTYSTDSGATWTPIKRLDDSIPSGAITDATAFMSVAANGTLYAAYFSYYPSYSPYARLILVKSYDGGNTFITHAAVNFTAADVVPVADSLIKAGLSIASNPTDTSNLVISGVSNRFGEPEVISYNTHDAGNTWNGPVLITNDQVGAYDTCHDLSWGSFSKTGTYGVAWRDRRNTSTGDSASFQIYGTISKNGGDSYIPNFLISDSISPPVLITRGDDFLGCALSDSNLYALWSDLRTGHENTFFNSTDLNKIPNAILSISDNSSIKVNAYPNPFHNETNIVINSAVPLQHCILQVFSMDGKLQKEIPIAGNGAYAVNLNILSSGTYIWSLIENNAPIAHGKWVVQ